MEKEDSEPGYEIFIRRPLRRTLVPPALYSSFSKILHETSRNSSKP